VDGFRETAARLSATAPIPLPTDPKARVMAEVATTRQLPPQMAPAAPRRGRPALISLAAAVVVIALLGFAFVVSRTGDDGTAQELAAVLSSPDAVTVDLAVDADGTLRVVYSASRDQAVLVGSGLDQAGADETYQLWAVSGTEPASAGVFLPGDDGEVASSVTAPGTPPDAWAVTVEPDGGSLTPTGDILYQGTTT